MAKLYCFGLGLGTKNKSGDWLEVFYPNPLVDVADATSKALISTLGLSDEKQTIELNSNLLNELISSLGSIEDETAATIADNARKLIESKRPCVAVGLTEDKAPASVPEAYLKLHLLSHRLKKPHGTDLSGIFGALPNVAWTNEGAIAIDELPERQLMARVKGKILTVECVDKFPKMTNYVVPKGVRIAHTARVRLGAHLGEGTTVMHEGFVNFNAGTLGQSMVEGRISAGVTVGEGSDLGGGSSTMGTLSGGGNMVISIGKESLIGANAGTGIPLGDRCTIESGLYITAGTKIALLDENNELVEHLKARELAGKNDLLFRRNSLTGVVECKTNRSAVALNEELHAHN